MMKTPVFYVLQSYSLKFTKSFFFFLPYFGCDALMKGIYNASYRAGAWAYIGETEELHVWRRSQQQTPLQGD